ncbi:rRNA maturation RNase YbeY [Jannaschia ovalis]|uniref:Endoribonuclease YbeY n=1 Tax=Jannaschia ovalis TaxID=3038773 RepID=A0ABY8LDS5_9RHOB|nr:rRNA maturation RNase YbeY [Jannaschia sp. GRR-S6-38]WGH79306.1 rRNA maturation RNase YbeY [Jannaschia sp. GRR-S6-38]
MTVETIIEDERWSDLDRLAGIAIPAALRGAGLDGAFEVAVLGCDDARIAALNAEFRGKAAPTNVLSWPSEARVPGTAPRDPELGDIAIAIETCRREAAAQGKPFEAHVIHLLVHATLHLLGHDHANPEEAEAMEAAETRILRELDLPDPYADGILKSAGL